MGAWPYALTEIVGRHNWHYSAHPNWSHSARGTSCVIYPGSGRRTKHTPPQQGRKEQSIRVWTNLMQTWSLWLQPPKSIRTAEQKVWAGPARTFLPSDVPRSDKRIVSRGATVSPFVCRRGERGDRQRRSCVIQVAPSGVERPPKPSENLHISQIREGRPAVIGTSAVSCQVTPVKRTVEGSPPQIVTLCCTCRKMSPRLCSQSPLQM